MIVFGRRDSNQDRAILSLAETLPASSCDRLPYPQRLLSGEMLLEIDSAYWVALHTTTISAEKVTEHRVPTKGR